MIELNSCNQKKITLIGACIFFGCFLGCGGDDYDPARDVHLGEDARARIIRRARVNADGLPASAGDFYLFDGGNFGGSIIYYTFICGSEDDCLRSVEVLGGIGRRDLAPWAPSRYAVVMDGPAFYFEGLRDSPWRIKEVRSGLSHERTRGNNEGMVFWAIDTDTNRVYCHIESGGFSGK